MGISYKGFNNNSTIIGVTGRPPEAMALKYNQPLAEYVRGSASELNPNANISQPDPYWDNVSLLVNFDNGTFNDLTGKCSFDINGTIQYPANPMIVNTGKFGGKSVRMNGLADRTASDRIYYFSPTTFQHGSSDFTYEGWFKTNRIADYQDFFSTYDAWNGITSTPQYQLYFYGQTNNPYIRVWDSASGQFTLGETILPVTVGEWFHFAWVRNGANFNIYFNGVNYLTYPAFNLNANGVIVGGRGDVTYGWDGDIDSVRITNGIARYTTSFTPPTEAFPTQ